MMSPTFNKTISTQNRKRWIGLCNSALLTMGLAVSGWAAQTVSLAWDSQEAGDSYTVYYGTESGNYISKIDTGASTSTVIPGLQEGQTYFIAVSARQADGIEGALSSEISYVTPGVLLASRSAITNSLVHMKFPVAPAHSYDVQASQDLATWQTIWSTTAVSNLWVEFDDAQTNSAPARYYRLLLH